MSVSKKVTMSTIDMISHYQRSIEKSPSDTKRLLHCLDKLYRMHITVKHLQETGIGRTVNALRKDGGEVGDSAKALVAKWKAMVAAESSDYSEEDNYNKTNEIDDKKEVAYKQQSQELNNLPIVDEKSVHSSSSKQDHSRKYSKTSHVESSNHHRSAEASTHHKKEKSSHHSDRAVASSSHRKSDKDHHQHSSKNSLSHKNRHGESSDPKSSHSHHSSDTKSNRTEKSSSSSKQKAYDEKRKQSTSSESGSSSGKRKLDSSEEECSISKRQKCDKPSTSVSSTTGHSKKKSTSSRPQEGGIEIDNSMGTSFADALGMITPVLSKSSKSIKPQASRSLTASTSSNHVQPSTSLSSKSVTKSVKKPDRSKKAVTPELVLLTQKATLPPLEDIVVDLTPTISNNYKPAPMNSLIMEFVYPQEPKQPLRLMTDEEMFQSISSKNLRTKVYSGVKSGSAMQVPSLHEMCIRVLQKNIDNLEYTGGVPFDILRPVMERATPDQLSTLEHYNPYLMDDSDALWEQHCNRKFRGHKRREMETWREMYARCSDEQDRRLSILTENIKHSQTVAVPLKQTKLAFVDAIVKPPRSVIRKQAQFGTERKLVATPAARVNALSNLAVNMAKVGDTRLKTLAAIRDTAQQSAANPIPLRGAKKAPLMAKTLQLMKGRYKR